MGKDKKTLELPLKSKVRNFASELTIDEIRQFRGMDGDMNQMYRLLVSKYPAEDPALIWSMLSHYLDIMDQVDHRFREENISEEDQDPLKEIQKQARFSGLYLRRE